MIVGKKTDWTKYYNSPYKTASFTRKITGRIIVQTLKKYFKIHGLDDYVVGVTPSFSYPKGRDDEIEQYLKENPNIKKFVIFDDSYIDRLSKKFPEEFIYCKYKLDKNAYDKALKILS